MSDQLARYPEYNQIIQAVLKADALLSGQKEVLELLAKRAPLFQVLHRLVSIVEEQYDGTFCSILLVDNVNKTFKAGVRVEYEKTTAKKKQAFRFCHPIWALVAWRHTCTSLCWWPILPTMHAGKRLGVTGL